MKETESSSNEILILQGLSQLQLGQFEDVIETFTALIAIGTNDDRVYRGRGLALTQLHEAVKAEADFMIAKKLAPHDPENWMGLALSQALQNKIYDAIKTYEDLIELKPDHIPAYVQLARVQFKIGAISRGRDIVTKAMTLKPALQQRRTMEAMIKEQDNLDKNRYYRPDFMRLKKNQSSAFANLEYLFSKIFRRKKEKV